MTNDQGLFSAAELLQYLIRKYSGRTLSAEECTLIAEELSLHQHCARLKNGIAETERLYSDRLDSPEAQEALNLFRGPLQESEAALEKLGYGGSSS